MPFDPDAYLKEKAGAQAPETQPESKAAPGESSTYSFGRGVVQGALYDPIEGIGQLIEHAGNIKLPVPQAVRKWLKDVRDETEKSTAGTAGRVTGAVGSLALAPEAFAAGKAASVAARAATATPRSTFALASKLGKAEADRRAAAYATAVGKHPRVLSNAELTEALLGHIPGQPWRTLSAPARVAVGAGTAAAAPVEGESARPENYAEAKRNQALLGGSLGGLAGSAVARGAGRVMRPSMHFAHIPFTGYGAYHLLGPTGLAATGGTLATLAALARGGGARSVAGLGGMAGQAVRALTEEAPNAETE
jgi:hypothetical protein